MGEKMDDMHDAVTAGQVARRIRQAGFKPARRTTRYEIIANV